MILYIFIDGIGYGENNPEKNPFARFPSEFFLPLTDRIYPEDSIFKNTIFHRTDPTLGIPGLPQSATGQTTLWTGINGARAIGRHLSGYPSFTLKKIISKYSVLKILNDNGFKASLLNCYSPKYLDHLDEKPRHVSTSTLLQMASGLPLKTVDDLRSGNGYFMDITHEYFKIVAKGYLEQEDELLKHRDPEESGIGMGNLMKKYDLGIFEYFITDKVGHARDWEKAEQVVSVLERFFHGLYKSFDFENGQLIISSDHGNFEDLSDAKHSMNPVPTILAGKHTAFLQSKINNLSDIVPAIYQIFDLDIHLNQDEFLIQN